MKKNDVLKLKSLILDQINDFVCVIFNEKHEIIFPLDAEKLCMYKTIVKNPTNVSGIYHVVISGQWYEKYTKIVEFNGELCTFEYYRNITKFKEIEQLLRNDYLTGISNRESTVLQIDEYILYALDHHEEFSVMISDVDHFKEINDTYGHLFGDIVLKNIGNLIISNTRHSNGRPADIAGRFGGDEFFGLVKCIGLDESIDWVNRANALVKSIVHTSRDGEVRLTDVCMSVGMYHVTKDDINEFNERQLSAEEIRKIIFDRCDSALYKVKKEHHEKSKNHSHKKTLH